MSPVLAAFIRHNGDEDGALQRQRYFRRVCFTRHELTGSRCIVISTEIPTPEISDLEDYNMHRAHRFISSLFLAAALAAPVATIASPGAQNASVQLRVYDRDHKDYHNWDDREDHAYRGYLTDQRQTYRVYNKQPHTTQRQYWNWRHSHPDKD
jgi:hypothetical protein